MSIKLKEQNKKFQPDSNILESPEAGWDNCLPYVSGSQPVVLMATSGTRSYFWWYATHLSNS